jgi:hypothetical protein
VIPLWVKLGYSAFVAMLVPIYLTTYGPANFLYFCDVALLLTLVAVWADSPLLAGMPAVGILLPQLVWVADFVAGFFGVSPIGLAEYMFRETIPLGARALSLFHGWLPFLLLWLVWRLGYDRRSFAAWTALGWLLLLVSYFAQPGPPAPADDPNLPVNVNYVYGLSESAPQHWLPPLAYLGAMMALLPLAAWWPTHLFLARFAPSSALRGAR